MSLRRLRVLGRDALLHRAGQKVPSLRTVASRDEKTIATLCADAHGFSLHSAESRGAHQRRGLERLCCCITRPVIANERRVRDGSGDVVLQRKNAWPGGVDAVPNSALAP